MEQRRGLGAFLDHTMSSAMDFVTVPLSRSLALLREQIHLILISIIILEAAFSASVILLPLQLKPTMSYLEISTIIAAFYVLSFTTAPYFGYLSDKIGRKKMLVFGTFIAAITFIPFPFYRSFSMFLILNAIKGIGSAAVAGPLMALFADLSPEGRNGEFMGQFYLARSAGGMVGFFIGGLAFDLIGGKSFLIFTIVMFASTFIFLQMREPHVQKERIMRFAAVWKAQQIEEGFEVDDSIGINPFKTIIESMKKKEFAKFSIAWLCFSSIIGIGVTYAGPIMLEKTRGAVNASFVGLVFLVVAGVVGLSQPLFGKLSDDYGRKPFLLAGTLATTIMAIILLGLVGLPDDEFLEYLASPLSFSQSTEIPIGLFIVSLPNFLYAIILGVLVLVAGSFASASLGFLADVTKEHERGRSMGLIQALLSVGNTLGITLGGIVFDQLGYLGVLGLVLFFSIIVSVVIIIFLADTRSLDIFSDFKDQ